MYVAMGVASASQFPSNGEQSRKQLWIAFRETRPKNYSLNAVVVSTANRNTGMVVNDILAVLRLRLVIRRRSNERKVINCIFQIRIEDGGH